MPGPTRPIDSPDPSLQQTIAQLDTMVAEPLDRRASVMPSTPGVGSRYALRDLLGAGGMGEVRLCDDLLIGREVAVKVMHAGSKTDPRGVARFIREARIQGCLEHPSIVPVHDMGRTPDGSAFFTMKRVRGETLADIVNRLAAGDIRTHSVYSRRKLLTAFVTVCLTVELAHQRGILHRDLKPANVMLGDFGEVYVLDWGIARVIRETDAASGGEQDAVGVSSATRLGELVGTPGYMSPEQARGDVVDARSDIYALGAILFELLSYEPLHRASTVAALLASTVGGVREPPSARAPEFAIEAELDAMVLRATSLDPADRFASARELAQLVEDYLDGARDHERQRARAAIHAERAVALADQAVERPGGLEHRAAALAEVGRALGLDPFHVDARRTLVRLLTTPPPETPPAAAAEIDAATLRVQRLAGTIGVIAYTLWLLAIPLAIWMGVARVDLFVVFVAAHALALVAMIVTSRSRTPLSPRTTAFATAAVLFATLTSAFIFGSLVMVPTQLAGVMTALLLNPRPFSRPFVVCAACLTVALPPVLAMLGVVQPSYAFAEGTMQVLPVMLRLPELPTMLALGSASLLTLLTLALAVTRIRDDLSAAQLRQELQAWQLAQLVTN